MERKLNALLFYLSAAGRAERRNAAYRREQARLTALTDDELLYDCVTLRARREYEKCLLLFLLPLALIGIAAIWGVFGVAVKGIWLLREATPEDASALLLTLLWISVLLTAAVSVGVICRIRSMYRVRCLLELAEAVKRQKCR